jgi:uncharacterized GH25 family protein
MRDAFVFRSVLVAVAMCAVIIWAAAGQNAVAQPAANNAVADGPREFELQVVGAKGRPAARAEVQIRMQPNATRDQIVRGEFVRGTKYSLNVRTDDEGKLALKLKKKPKYFALFVETPGYGPYWAAWDAKTRSEELPEKFVAEVDEAWSVGGIVVDLSGKPVKGAKVHPSIEFKKRPGDQQQLMTGAEVVTDAAGKWRYDSVPASQKEIHVAITHPELMPEGRSLVRSEFGIENKGERTAKIVLKAGLVVTGHVTDEAGKPMAGALVRTHFMNNTREAKTGEDGSYRLVGCEEKMARIVVWAKGKAMDMQQLRIEPEMGPVDFVMKPGGKIRVRVLDKEGRPLAKSRIFFQRWRGRIEYFEFDKVNQYADKNGVWEWNEAPLDEVKADICPPNGMQLEEQSLVPRAEEYVFRPPSALVIAGKVTDAKTKEPVKSFVLVPGYRNGPSQVFWNRRDSFVGKDGQYKIERNRGTAHVIRVEADGYRPAESEDIKGEDENVVLDFELEHAANLAGEVVTPDGKPAAHAKLAIGAPNSQIYIRNGNIDSSSTFAAQMQADEAGKFQFPAQDAAFTLVVTDAAGYAIVPSDADWKEDVIKLQPWARVEGTFLIGKKVGADVAIDLYEDSVSRWQEQGPRIFTQTQTTADSKGQFVFDRVFAGKCRVGRRLIYMVDEGATEVTSSKMIPFECKNSETKTIQLGGDGRKVVAQLQLPKEFNQKVMWSQARVNAQVDLPPINAPPAPAAVQNDQAKYQAWFAEWMLTDEGRAYRTVMETNNRIRQSGANYTASVDKDDRFSIDDVGPGNYRLTVYFDRQVGLHGPDRHFAVPAASDAASGEEPIDLGVVQLESK